MKLSTLDLIIIGLFFLLMLGIGIYAYFRNKSSEDYFVAGGSLPWWLSGISHHVSGYSGAVFVAYAALAYTHGISVYFWWAFTIGIGILVSAKKFPVLWMKLRKVFHIQSPLEFLKIRYNLFTQQLMAWSGVLLKLFDIGAKWASIAILLNVFTGISLPVGILVSGGISLLYITFGGLWAVVITDFAQFIVQLLAGVVMFIAVLMHLDGLSTLSSLWQELPEGNSQVFYEPYTVGFALAFLFINFLSYNGGQWNLATRYISSPSEQQVVKAAKLSGWLYLIWPLILFFPMWAAPVLLPDLADPSQSYGELTLLLLPSGLVGLVIASLFANTMSMTSSDINTIAAVISRDILPNISVKIHSNSLKIARTVTFVFTSMTILVALQFEYFGGVLGLIISWFGALVGPIAIPLLLGLIPAFQRCGATAAISSILAGLSAFIFTKNVEIGSLAIQVSLPLMISFITYVSVGLLPQRKIPEKVSNMFSKLNQN